MKDASIIPGHLDAKSILAVRLGISVSHADGISEQSIQIPSEFFVHGRTQKCTSMGESLSLSPLWPAH